MSKQVATKKDTLPALAGDFEEAAGAGFEGADAEAYAIPFLAILQSNSPQVSKSNSSYIKGAEEGMLLDTVENAVIDPGEDGISVIPCFYRRAYVEWIPRDSGGGYVGEYTADEAPRTERDEDGRDILPNGNELMDTRYHYVLYVREDGSYSPVVIAMTRTQVKKSRRWMSQMQNIKFPRKDGSGSYTPPMFSHVYKLKVIGEQKDEYSWMNWDIAGKDILEDPELVAAAAAFRDAIVGGQVKEATESQQTTSADTSESDPSF